MARMTGFVFQDDYLERTARLSDQEFGRLVRALAKYHATGEQQELAGRECGYFDFIKADIDRIDGKYEARCQTNRNNRTQAATNADDSQRTITIVNDRQRTSTNASKDKDKDINIITTTAHAREEQSDFGTINVDPLIIKVQQELNGLTDTHYGALEDYRQQLGDDLISYAIDVSVGNGVRNWSYVQAILQGWLRAGVRNIGEAKADQERHRQQSAPQRGGKVVGAQKYQQRDYKEKDLQDALGVSDLFREAAG